MIVIPKRAVVIPTHTTPEMDGIPAKEYFDILYYADTGHSMMFHSMTTSIPLEELEPHIAQMDELKIAVEIHIPIKSDEKQVTLMRSQAKQAFQSVQERLEVSQIEGSPTEGSIRR